MLECFTVEIQLVQNAKFYFDSELYRIGHFIEISMCSTITPFIDQQTSRRLFKSALTTATLLLTSLSLSRLIGCFLQRVNHSKYIEPQLLGMLLDASLPYVITIVGLDHQSVL